jgi:hopanoid-associated phosphorylase
MTEEGNIAVGQNVISVLSGGSLPTLMQNLNQIDPSTIKAVISFGVAGALDPRLRVGDIVVATSVTNDQRQVFDADTSMVEEIVLDLKRSNLYPHVGPTFGTTIPRYNASDKAALWKQSHAIAVDMESEGAAQWARAHGLPFAMIRTISDNQSFTLPPAALTAVNADGTYNVGAVIQSVLNDPFEFGGLIELAFNAMAAFDTLNFVRWAVDLGSL